MYLSKQPSTPECQVIAKSGVSGSRLALFGAAIVLSALALAIILTKSFMLPADRPLVRISSEQIPLSTASLGPQVAVERRDTRAIPIDLVRAVLDKDTGDPQTGGQAVLTTVQPSLTPSPAENAEAALAARLLEEEQAAKIVLAVELAKGMLRRRLLAARDGNSPAVAGASGASVDVASVSVEVDEAPNGTMIVAALETGIEQTATGEETVETELAIAETLPEVAPVPSRRPAAPRRAEAKDKGAKDKAQKSYPKLAYAAAEDPSDDDGNGVFSGLSKVFHNGGKARLPGRGSGIAVYDIKSATVYMPDGQKLEAHSGLGHMKDNPSYATRKNRGPTPPNVYNLVMRERRYHGVEAVRMLPADRGAMHGRDGMLAHTPLVRGTNGSHGCVAFKNYARFLKAFKAGKVRKMIVVPNLSELPVYMASL